MASRTKNKFTRGSVVVMSPANAPLFMLVESSKLWFCRYMVKQWNARGYAAKAVIMPEAIATPLEL